MRTYTFHTLLRFSAALGVALGPLACSDSLPPPPSDLSLSPSFGVVGVPTVVTVRGKNLTPFIVTDFSKPSRSRVEPGLKIRLGGVDLVDVTILERDAISVVIPKVESSGPLDLTVIDRYQRVTTLENAFTVRSQDCESLNGEGFDCAGCDATPGCVCDQNQVCGARCGDGMVLPEEACDDRNLADGDGCSAACTVEAGYQCAGSPSLCTPLCGDGQVQGKEPCDDGNVMVGDGCGQDCAVEIGFTCTSTRGQASSCRPRCGDGLVVGPEACDDGNRTGGDGCDPACALEPGYTCMGSMPSACSPTCGDGLVRGAEACDDHGLAPNDGCSATCTVEVGFTCAGEPSSCAPICGDGLVVGSEPCDDANPTANDGCTACAIDRGYSCIGSPSVCMPGCGDGIVAGSEACDDHNNMPGDGCSAACAVENGWTCPQGMNCVSNCGDGLVVGTEVCDDGNMMSRDGCVADCTAVELGFSCPSAGGACSGVCGDGRVVAGEACDDGDTMADDGCSETCLMVEAGFTCPPMGGACASICGDSLRVGSETCDDGDTTPSDGCSETCSVELGWTCPSTGRCTPTCGDGRLRGDEACDDSGTTPGDGCSAMCAVEPGWVCRGAPSSCTEVCGNGVLDAGETCDDGGRRSGDGCDVNCAVESGFVCVRVPSRCVSEAVAAIVDDSGASCPAGPGAGRASDPFCRIEDALASNRSVLLVRAGQYAGPISIAMRDVEILAEDGAAIDDVGTSTPALVVSGGSRVSITGLSITGGGTRLFISGAEVMVFESTLGPGLTGTGVEVTNGATLTLDRARITGNPGGGLHLETTGSYALTNVIVDGNGSFSSMFGGIHLVGTSSASVLTNCTVVGNQSGADAMSTAGVRCDRPNTRIVNSIVFGNTLSGMPSSVSSSCAPSFSDLAPSAAGVGNISDDPELDAQFHLGAGSPAVDAGDPGGVTPAGPAPRHDFDGQTRPRGARVDMGADEAR